MDLKKDITYKGNSVYKDGNRLGMRKAKILLERKLYKTLSFGERYGRSGAEISKMFLDDVIRPRHLSIGASMCVPARMMATAESGMSAVACLPEIEASLMAHQSRPSDMIVPTISCEDDIFDSIRLALEKTDEHKFIVIDSMTNVQPRTATDQEKLMQQFEEIRKLPKPKLIDESDFTDCPHFDFPIHLKEGQGKTITMMSTPSGRVPLRREDITSDMIASKEDSKKYWDEVKKRIAKDGSGSIYN